MKNKILSYLVWLIFILIVISCTITILNNDLYRDGEWVNAQWLGQDVISLILGAPLLLLAHWKSKNWKWRWVRTGVLLYFVYTYAFFMFGARLTFFYWFHLPIFGLSMFGFLYSLVMEFKGDNSYDFNHKIWKRSIVFYLLLMSVMIGLLWIVDIGKFLIDPTYVSNLPDGEAPLLIYSLDLGIIIPAMIIAAVGFWRKERYGYLLTGIMLVKTTTLGFSLMAMSVSLYLNELELNLFLVYLWCVIGLVGGMLTWNYLRRLECSTTAVL